MKFMYIINNQLFFITDLAMIFQMKESMPNLLFVSQEWPNWYQ